MSDLLFVAGLGRSGTTALMEALVAHEEIALGVERFKRLYPRDDEPVTAIALHRGPVLRLRRRAHQPHP